MWLQFAVECGYLDRKSARGLYREYDGIISQLVVMSAKAEKWLLPHRTK